MALTCESSHKDNRKIYILFIGLLISTYCVFQFFFIPYPMFCRDELWFAHHIYQFTRHLPYRDFLPYKTTIGYYLLSLPMFVSHDVLAPLYYIKDEIALINSIMLLGIASWSFRYFQPKAIFLTLLLIVSSHLFLIYSVDLRTDMLACWFGLISVLLMLSNRSWLSGTVLAIGFLISPKDLWFFMATNVALIMNWAVNRWDENSISNLTKFNSAIIIILIAYISFWSHLSSLDTVIHSLFYEAYTQAKIHYYSQAYYLYWHVIMSNGPLLTLLWPLTWVNLLIYPLNDSVRNKRFFITIYTSVIMLMVISYQQPFFYNTVFFVPAYFLIYTDFFSCLFSLKSEHLPALSFITKRKLYWFLSLYSMALISVIIILGLPSSYFLILAIPLLLYIVLVQPNNSKLLNAPFLILLSVIFIGIFYPLLRLVVIAKNMDGDYQKTVIKNVSRLLKQNDGYVATTPLLYQRDQSIPGLKNLIAPAIEYLHTQSPKLLPILIPSLYLTPRTPQQVVDDLRQAPVKLYTNNVRIMVLPKKIRQYLSSQYLHFWGGIYLYAPEILAHDHTFILKFDGDYQIISKAGAKVIIDNQVKINGSIIPLVAGKHITNSYLNYRLKFIPDSSTLDLPDKYRADMCCNLAESVVI